MPFRNSVLYYVERLGKATFSTNHDNNYYYRSCSDHRFDPHQHVQQPC